MPFEVIHNILQNFSTVLNSESIERGLQKQLLHMLISEITIDKRREIDTIKIHLTDELAAFLNENGGTPQSGVPLNFCLKQFGIPYIDLELAI